MTKRQCRYNWGLNTRQAVLKYQSRFERGEKREVCIVVELTGRPTIRVVPRLYSERTKPCPLANEKALTS